MNSLSSRQNRAGSLLRILGEHLPPEVYRHLGPEATGKLLETFHKTGKPDSKEEREVLSSFLNSLTRIQKEESIDPESLNLIRELEALLKEEKEERDLLQELKTKSAEEISRIVSGENSDMIALVLCFGNPDAAAAVLNDFPEARKEEILIQIHDLDLSSEYEKNRLERFLKFKLEALALEEKSLPIKNQRGKKAADLLGRLQPGDSQKIFDRIREKRPGFAENIIEHFFRMEDLLFLERDPLNRFFSSFHPIVLACALKGTETEVQIAILEKLEPALSSSIRLESDSMGPISLAEMETAQNGILERLRDAIEEGSIKFWRAT
ncbi:FliG C-terminal domain-containing protein [Leptospira yasudae]|uniref:Flagellar motor switch protein FliG n=1 Tax=Leptospira yasudae TaxID=2202201 RepID=A0A5F2AV78_9LEPT|nr:FliG C-terminal domain-containing protein [Leptospira yasudae]MBW0434457.1 endoflagellar motor switch protein [Leptospira yasudae]TGL76147.1 endoflagellar motor switch protein [Leptospira yasudae]TGL79298.1 endoflagellar motor switch protein [Leptospira yasudae]TGL82985.1 endoflagellar motor switch protein [Leptospira yasudae]TGM99285.1 endoflagellar motor switch protein [Leptospira yasudae]